MLQANKNGHKRKVHYIFRKIWLRNRYIPVTVSRSSFISWPEVALPQIYIQKWCNFIGTWKRWIRGSNNHRLMTGSAFNKEKAITERLFSRKFSISNYVKHSPRLSNESHSSGSKKAKSSQRASNKTTNLPYAHSKLYLRFETIQLVFVFYWNSG